MLNTKFNSKLYAGYSFVALLLYFSFLILPSFHLFAHSIFEEDDHDVECAEAHDNECHQYIVHFVEDFKCAHKDHISETHEDCDLCAISSITVSHHNKHNDTFMSFDYLYSISFYTIEHYSQISCFHEKVRGPPIA